MRCPKCQSDSYIKHGNFFRPSDGRWIQRYRCNDCNKNFSSATFEAAYRQNKRKVNFPLGNLLASGVSMRRAALLLRIHFTTVTRKLFFLAAQANKKQNEYLASMLPVSKWQFDELQTIEHSKCKPLAVAMAVTNDRKILGIEVSKMPATGLLSKIAQEKYGKRTDERIQGLKKLFAKISPLIAKNSSVTSDEHPFYPLQVKKFFPDAEHMRVKGARGCIAGQGELKKLHHDPLFALNHSFAMLRANINRLFRRTWCTTKKIENLRAHLAIYIQFHNSVLT